MTIDYETLEWLAGAPFYRTVQIGHERRDAVENLRAQGFARVAPGVSAYSPRRTLTVAGRRALAEHQLETRR